MMKFVEEVIMMENNAEIELSGTEEELVGESSRRRRPSPQIIAKRRRTKRRRLSGTGVCGSVSSTEVGGEKDRNYESSVTTTTEEEEDMANCLIMLARSGSRIRSISNDDEVNFDESSQQTTTEINKLNKMETESSPSLIVTGVNSNVVYECKTCDKAFQSFQALGGHRASHHKKPKNLFLDDLTNKVKHSTAKASALLVVNKQPSPAPDSSYAATTLHSSSKVHECSICGSAFSSGQALGGHMRRHRTTTTATVVAATNNHDKQMGSVAAAAVVDVDAELAQTEKAAILLSDRYIRSDDSDNNTNNSFLASLDLNLPAPTEEQDQDEDQMSHSQRKRLFGTTVQGSGNPSTTAPPLIDCYF